MASMTKMEALGDLKRFEESMLANVAELEAYEASRIKFAGLVAEAQELNRQQAALAASKQDISRRLQSVLIEAQRLATVLRFALKEHYGPDSEKLVEFGIQPFRGRTFKSKPEEPPAPEAPAEAETSPAESE